MIPFSPFCTRLLVTESLSPAFGRILSGSRSPQRIHPHTLTSRATCKDTLNLSLRHLLRENSSSAIPAIPAIPSPSSEVVTSGIMDGDGLYPKIPPDALTREQVNPILLMSWWATAFSLAIIVVRLCGRYIRIERFFTEDKLMMVSVIPLTVRMIIVHYVLVLGTNNVKTIGLTAEQISNREMGSKLVLAARIFYAILYGSPVVLIHARCVITDNLISIAFGLRSSWSANSSSESRA